MEVPGKKLQAGPSTADTTYCQPCEQDDEILPAEAFCTICKEFFCSKCASLHRKQKMSRSHALLNKSDMPTYISVIEDEYECTELCEIHPKEIIKYFCPTHHTLICGHCVVHNHRTCHVDVISDVSKAFKDGHEYGDIINTIACLFEDIDSCASDVDKNVEAVAKLCKNEINKLRRYREEVNKYFEDREQALLKLIEKMKIMDDELLGSLKPKYTNLKSKLEEINVKLEGQKNNMIQLFIETKRAKNILESLQNDLADINKVNVIHHYEFKKDPTTERLIASDTGLGTLEHIVTEPHKIATASASDHGIIGLTVQGGGQWETITTPEPTESQASVDLTISRFTQAMDIPLKSPTDKRDCYLSSMLHLAGSRLLLADFQNNKVKMVDMQTNSLISQISVPGQPWDICLLSGDRVAVTLANKGIQFLKARGQLALGGRIKVDGDCRGIAYHGDMLIVSFYNGNLKVLNMNGHVLKPERKCSDQKQFGLPYYLTVVNESSSAYVYVSDNHRNSITKLDMNLNILKTFRDPALKGSGSITVIGKQLLICRFGGDSIMIMNLSNGQMTQLIGKKNGIQGILYAYYCPPLSKLLVTQYANNSIKVYNIIK